MNTGHGSGMPLSAWTPRNERAGNGPYATKVKAYAASALKITSTIPSYGTWTPATIEKRAEWLADHAVKTWPLIAPPPK